MNAFDRIVGHTGNFAWSFFRTVFDMVGLFYDTIIEISKLRKRGLASAVKQIISQTLFTGVEAFWLVGPSG